MKAVELVIRDINARGGIGGKKVELIIEDAQTSECNERRNLVSH